MSNKKEVVVKDFFGNEIEVGDTIMYIDQLSSVSGYRRAHFGLSYVERITEKTLIVKPVPQETLDMYCAMGHNDIVNGHRTKIIFNDTTVIRLCHGDGPILLQTV